MARPAPPPRVTFQDNRLLDPSVQNMLLDRIKQMHGSGFQQDVSFGDVYKNGQYDFSKYDVLVNNARARGLKNITFRLFGTPKYVAENHPGVATQLSADNPNAAMAGKFAEAVAGHFAGRVDRYGVWNEPNAPSFLNRDLGTAAKDYRQIYRSMYKAIKGVRPAARVGFGEITSGGPTSPNPQSTIGFLKAVLAAGNKPLHADYVGVHPYQWTNPNTKYGNPLYGGIGNIQAVQDEIRKQAAAGKLLTGAGRRPGLAITEFGYKHDAVPNSATRARYMRRALQIAYGAGVRDVNLYQLLPSKAGDYWDSSLLGTQGQIPTGLAATLARRGRRPR